MRSNSRTLSSSSSARIASDRGSGADWSIIDGAYETATTGGLNFTTAIDANAIVWAQAQVRRWLSRVFVRGSLLPADDARAIRQWQHGGGFSADGPASIEAADRTGRERLLRYFAWPPFALNRLRELDPKHLLHESTKQGPGGTARSSRRRWNSSTALRRCCRHRVPRSLPFRVRGAIGRSAEIPAASPNVRNWPIPPVEVRRRYDRNRYIADRRLRRACDREGSRS
jgi:hypothetical protein